MRQPSRSKGSQEQVKEWETPSTPTVGNLTRAPSNTTLRMQVEWHLSADIYEYYRVSWGVSLIFPPTHVWFFPGSLGCSAKYLFLLCSWVFCMPGRMCSIWVPCTHRDQQRVSDPWNWSSRWLWTTVRVLWAEPRGSTRVMHALNH